MILIDIFISNTGEVALQGHIEELLEGGEVNLSFSDGTALEIKTEADTPEEIGNEKPTEDAPDKKKEDKKPEDENTLPPVKLPKVNVQFHHKGHSFKGLISDPNPEEGVLEHYRIEGNLYWATVNGHLHRFYV